ncbi:MAG TPA: SHOCT domain-containing protein [Mycobacterium sp.]
MMYDHDMGWWGWAGMAVGMVLFWALVIGGIVALVAYITGDRDGRQIPPGATLTASPEQVLADRFARGEINETEYRDRLAALREHAHG